MHPDWVYVLPVIEAALAQSRDLVIVADPSLVIRFASIGARELLGYEPAEIIGRSGIDFFHPDDVTMFATVASMASQGYVPRSSVFYRLRHADGTYVTLELSGGAVLSADGQASGFWLVGRRPARAEIYAEVLHRLLAEQPLAVALENVCAAMIPDTGPKFCITFWLPGKPVITVGHRLHPLLSGRDRRPGSPWDRALSTGRPFTTVGALSDLDPETTDVARQEGLASLTVIPVSGLHGVPVATLTQWTPPGHPHADASAEVLQRIRELVEAAIRLHQQIEQLRRHAASDPLTGLANRRAVDATMVAAATDVESSVLYLDLDRFKEVNDTYGHGIGDELLKVVARRLGSLVRSDDLVARLGGDEFAIVCHGCGSEEAARLASRILDALRDPVIIDGRVMRISGSIGVATSLGLNGELLQLADNALYEAKQSGRDTVRSA